MAGPFKEPPIPNLHRNKINLIPKSIDPPGEASLPVARTDAFRLIVDLSAPRDRSVNAGIPD